MADKHRDVVYFLATFNQREFVAEAVDSALAQDFPNLTLFISDDQSTDNTFDIIERCVSNYTGPHVIRLNRNAKRLGWIEHFISIVERVGDAFIITAHGDDTSRPDRTRRLVEAWKRFGVSMVSSGACWINSTASKDDGNRRSRLISAEEIVSSEWLPEMLGAALAFEANLLTAHERLDSRIFFTGIDHVLPLRAATSKGFYYLNEPLIGYRRHGGNLSNFLADMSSSPEIHLEGIFSRALAIRAKEHEDLVNLTRKHPFNWRYRRLVQAHKQRIVQDLTKWSHHRFTLAHEGLMPTWVPRSSLETKPRKFEVTF